MKTTIKSYIFVMAVFCTSFYSAQQYTGDQGLVNGTESESCIKPSTTWWLGGNLITNPAPLIPNTNPFVMTNAAPLLHNNIGTCNNYDFILKSNNLLTMWIKPSTKVGISEPNPVAKFEVLETDPLSGEEGGLYGRLLSSFRAKVLNDYKHNEWVYKATSSENGWQDYALHDALSVDDMFTIPGFTTRTWWERLPGQNIQKWGNALNTYMTLSQNRLTVYDQVLVGSEPTAPNSAALCVNVSSTMYPNSIEVYDETLQKIQFRVKSNGFVYAREINVMPMNINFPDYVFGKNYKLKPLNELEAFIALNKHLPNIPSAKEVSANGINLAEMQVKQMEKIEELFLYVIDLKKENEALKKKMALLENKN